MRDVQITRVLCEMLNGVPFDEAIARVVVALQVRGAREVGVCVTEKTPAIERLATDIGEAMARYVVHIALETAQAARR